ncbi:putative acidic mammalian chitinase-like [Capsicum annuum]|nr:putative acidic mammalian chitinase-like [Capsicum annuum]
MARTNSSRKSFIDSSIRLAREFGFHGLDLGWQYPQSTSDMTNLGVPTRKMVLAIPYCGFAWRLVNENIHGVRAPADGKANVSFDDGSMTYAQIRDFIVQNRATTVYNNTIVGDYCYSGSTWISYDDTQVC